MTHYHYPENIRKQVSEIVEPFRRADEWEALDIPDMPKPHGIILLSGLPGTGKTTLAYDILKKTTNLPKASILTLAMGGTASEKFGQTEKAIVNLTNSCINQTRPQARPQAQAPGFFLDDCDAIIWDRSRVTDGAMYMLSIVNTLLASIDRVQEAGGMIVLATNHAAYLDTALESRVTDHIRLSPPIGEDARKIWLSLMPPPPFGFELPDTLPPLVPRDIRNYILREARAAFLERRNMLFSLDTNPK